MLVFALALLAAPAHAQILTPTTLTTALSQPRAKVGTELDLIVTAKIRAGWHLYSTDFSAAAAPLQKVAEGSAAATVALR